MPESVGPENFSEMIEKAAGHAETRVRNSNYLNKPRPTVVSQLLMTFVEGVLRADPWNMKYALPPGFESVVNYVAFNLIRHFGRKQIIDISINEAVELVWGFAMDNPRFPSWGEYHVPYAITTVYDGVQEHRTFIDLQAAKMNMRLSLSKYHQSFERGGDAVDPESRIEPKP